MQNDTKNSKNTYSAMRIAIYIAAAIILLSLVGNVIAKYSYSTHGQSVVSAQEFYFTSDILDAYGTVYNLVPITENVEIKLMNHADALRFSEQDIEYTVSLKEGETVVAAKSGVIPGNAVSSATVTFPVESGKTYVVTATGNAGYVQTLTATIVVLPKSKNLYKSAENTNAYVALTVWSQDVSGDLTVDFPEGVIPDNTDDAMKDVLTSDGEFTDSVNFDEAFSSHTYRFFKTTTAEVSAAAFDVECGGITATVKTPDK